jgi:hypothetical protein
LDESVKESAFRASLGALLIIGWQGRR